MFLFKVRMEKALGQPMRFTHCDLLSTLTDELATLDSDIRVVVIACMTEIIASLINGQDPAAALKRGMGVLNSALFALSEQRGGSIRIVIAPCTPRMKPNFDHWKKYAIVSNLCKV